MKRWVMFSAVLTLALLFLVSCGGAKVETEGESSIYMKAKEGQAEMVSAAIRDGFDVNRQDENGQTLLHHAVSGNQAQLVEILCEKFHANPRIQDKDGYTPVDLTEQNSPIDVILANY